MINLNSILTPEIRQILRILAVVATTFHVLLVVVFFRGVSSATNLVKTSKAALFKTILTVHIFALLGILLLILFY